MDLQSSELASFNMKRGEDTKEAEEPVMVIGAAAEQTSTVAPPDPSAMTSVSIFLDQSEIGGNNDARLFLSYCLWHKVA